MRRRKKLRHLQGERQTEWQSATARFDDNIRSLKRDLQSASSKGDIDKCLDRIALGDRDLVDEIVPDAGAYRVALKRGDVTKARSMILQGLDGWAGRIRSKHERMDLDSAGLDKWSYDNSPAERLGRGNGRWS